MYTHTHTFPTQQASHIDVQLGEYERTIRSNMEAVQADLKFKVRNTLLFEPFIYI